MAATPLRAPGFLGLSGLGQIIGLADSGLDRGSAEDIHPDLRSLPRKMPKVVMLKSWAGAPVASDPTGHGTHMAAAIAGTGAASDGKYRGIAPDASIYFQGLLNAQGALDPPPDLASLFGPAYEAGVRVHVNGWGGGTGGYLAAASQVDRFVRGHPDFLVVFAAGNSGPGRGTLTPEAHTKNGLVVGASQSPHPLYDPEQTDTGAIASFSSRGPAADGRMKPDLLAPGASVSALSSAAGGSGGLYGYMQGSSVAAAAAGGSAALLRQYFQKFEGVAQPTAALLKAALICGARTPRSGPDGTSFGVLDLGATVLSLKEKTLRWVDAREGIGEGESATYTFRVTGSGSPLKVALVWTDPEAAPGSARPLVNNLDLVVHDPSGKEWRGNSFLFPDRPDDVNNAELVYIPEPKEGVYTIVVKGERVAVSAVSGASKRLQDYALVYGQPLREDVVVSSGGGKAALASGAVVDLSDSQVVFARNESLVDWREFAASQEAAGGERALAGADIYLPPDGGGNPRYAYIALRTWRGEGVQVVRSAAGRCCVEMNPVLLASGYYFAEEALGSLLVNGEKVADPEDVPPGGEVAAGINPRSQRIWSAEFSYEEREGILEGVDAAGRRLYLLGEPAPYRLSSSPALSYADRSADVDPADYPFGWGFSLGWEELRPGLRVKLVLSRTTGEVICVKAQRDIIAGAIAEVDGEERRVVISTGNSYSVPAGISVELDGRDADLTDLRPGYYMAGVLLPDTREVIAIEARSRAVYGRLVYINHDQGTLYLVDDCGDFRLFTFGAAARFYRFGIPVDAKGVRAGCWARLFLDKGGTLARADLAEVTPERREVFVSYEASKGVLRTDAGSYVLSRRTLVTKNGYPVPAEDLVPGEELAITAFLSGPEDKPLLAAAAATTRPGVSSPVLEVAAPWRGEAVIISGKTSADKVYVRLPSGERLVAGVGRDGRFVCSVPTDALPPAGGGSAVLQVIAVDSTTGGVVGQFVTVPAERSAAFPDLAGHWAAADVSALYAAGVVQGYPDGSFRPDALMTRAEFVVLLAKAIGWSGSGGSTGFADDQEIPAWARPYVARAHREGLVSGYPDGRFLPGRFLSRSEAAVLLDAALRVFEPAAGSSAEALPWRDKERIPGWALPAVERLYAAGIMRGRSAEAFDPDAGMTRAEMAAAACRLLEAIRSQ